MSVGTGFVLITHPPSSCVITINHYLDTHVIIALLCLCFCLILIFGLDVCLS